MKTQHRKQASRPTARLLQVIEDHFPPIPLDQVQEALAAGATITPDLLVEACRRADDGLALLLLEHGADPQWRWKRGGWSAFAHAKRNRHHMPLTWSAITRQMLAQKVAAKRRSRAWASGVALPARRAL